MSMEWEQGIGIRYEPSATSYQLSAISHKLSAINHIIHHNAPPQQRRISFPCRLLAHRCLESRQQIPQCKSNVDKLARNDEVRPVQDRMGK